ncbi:hypothetical protein VFPPC_11521 [Pochonia chlamydosporia 170]|uniref:Uncharacterized protein n=1 Tax=Pochonia chlamydosporia 170 TaxID=1380566 RepID=A0A179F0R9_METCM|nr:hypothetical protein VFPPC_11521 [Pochonia chlamydosporia 170]OAQ59021.1 hypothetical protein VFPPC_11521 [Pochonia chlamydosporia 170]
MDDCNGNNDNTFTIPIIPHTEYEMLCVQASRRAGGDPTKSKRIIQDHLEKERQKIFIRARRISLQAQFDDNISSELVPMILTVVSLARSLKEKQIAIAQALGYEFTGDDHFVVDPEGKNGMDNTFEKEPSHSLSLPTAPHVVDVSPPPGKVSPNIKLSQRRTKPQRKVWKGQSAHTPRVGNRQSARLAARRATARLGASAPGRKPNP